ncbi:ABC transporter substrate binding protein [Thermodesulfobacteriota bacterium]
MELWIGALNLGFLYAFMTMGVFITFRIHDFPDITVDGSFTAGAAAAAVLLVSGVNPFIALGAAFAIGAAAGSVTALIHTRFKVNGLLAGILVMTGLYSTNLHVMGRSNIPLLNQTTVFSCLAPLNPGLPPEVWTAVVLCVCMALFWLVVSLFFKTDLGIAMRITGNNPAMAAANGVNVGGMTVFGVALANGLVGVSGGLVAQYQGFADIGMGIGTIVVGLAAVIIGESVFRMRSMYARVLSAIIGSVIFRFMIAVALFVGMNPIDLKLLTAIFVLITLIVSKSIAGGNVPADAVRRVLAGLVQPRRAVPALLGVLILAALAFSVYTREQQAPGGAAKKVTIGFLQVSDNGLLNITRDSFVREMQRLGYRQGENCTILLENANGDLPTVNTILDKFIQENVDIVVPVSTACTQAAINKIKDRPVVFATVANPFIIGAGKTETQHRPNVTGVYGWAPMDKTMAIVRELIPGRITVGAIWDPAHANSVFNVENLQKAVRGCRDVSFAGATVTSSSEVYQAALSLVQKDIDAFVLSPDNIVYSAFESVVKAARARKIPVFISDVERLADGALGALGYDYSISGIQAARLVDRVLRGESPGQIPFERYSKLTFGLNLEAARELGITVPPAMLGRATKIHGTKAARTAKRTPRPAGPQKKLALFLFSDHSIIRECARGVTDELEQSGTLRQHNLRIDIKNAQNEFYIAQSIVQDIIRQAYDYIITLSTPALQVTAQGNKKIPHVFGAVTDPYRMGVAKSAGEHLPQVTGVATLQPVEATIQVMREIFPEAKKIGIVWNAAEACSEACTYKAREAAPKYGFELLEANVSSTAEVLDGVKSLLSRDIDLFITSGDNTVLLALDSIAGIMRQHRIPYFTNGPSDVEHGAFLSIGADYYEVGRQTARVACRVINGERPRDIPIRDCVPEKMYLNLALAEAYGISVPEAVIKRAAKVIR